MKEIWYNLYLEFKMHHLKQEITSDIRNGVEFQVYISSVNYTINGKKYISIYIWISMRYNYIESFKFTRSQNWYFLLKKRAD